MIIRGYGISLVQLTEHDLELVRVMRNSEQVRDHMQFREHITPEMQQKWFARINNEHNNFFVIESNGKKVGLINGSEVDWEQGITGNGGIFIWDESFRDSVVPTAASLLLSDLTFIVGLKKVRIKILRDNQKAINYNQQLGFRLVAGQEAEENQLYEMDEFSYAESVANLKKSLHKLHGREMNVTIDNPDHPFCARIIRIYANLPEEVKQYFKLSVV
jgi:RimJ/RimL family protein N-acetyltransferase